MCTVPFISIQSWKYVHNLIFWLYNSTVFLKLIHTNLISPLSIKILNCLNCLCVEWPLFLLHSEEAVCRFHVVKLHAQILAFSAGPSELSHFYTFSLQVQIQWSGFGERKILKITFNSIKLTTHWTKGQKKCKWHSVKQLLFHKVMQFLIFAVGCGRSERQQRSFAPWMPFKPANGEIKFSSTQTGWSNEHFMTLFIKLENRSK